MTSIIRLLVLNAVLSVTCVTAASTVASEPAVSVEPPASVRLDKGISRVFGQVVASDGTTVALWRRSDSDADVTTIRAAIRRPNQTTFHPARTLASWHGLKGGSASLAAGASGRAFASWVNGSGQVVMMRWDTATGWGRRMFVPGAATNSSIPTIAVNPTAGIRAIAYVRVRRDAVLQKSVLKVAVHLNGEWRTRTVGPSGDIRFVGSQSKLALVIDGDGNLTVAWRFFSENEYGDVTGFASRLAAGDEAWEQPHDFGWLGEFDPGVDPLLALDPDGAVNLFQTNDEPTQGNGMVELWRREGTGDWSTVGDVPGTRYADGLGQVETNARGDLIVTYWHRPPVVRPVGGELAPLDVPAGWAVWDAVLAEDGRIAVFGASADVNRHVQVMFGSVGGALGDPVSLTVKPAQRGSGDASLSPNGSISLTWSQSVAKPHDSQLRGTVTHLPD